LHEAEAALRAGRMADAVAIIRELMLPDSTDAALWHRLAKLGIDQAGTLDVAAAAHTAAALAPDRLEYRLTLAEVLLRAGNVAGAIMQYEFAALIAADPDIDVAAGLAQALTIAGLHEDAARACLEVERAGRMSAADRERLQAAVKRRPEPAAQTRAMGLSLVEEGERREAAGQPQQALAAFVRGAQLLPGVAKLHYRIGRLLQDLGRAEAAQSHYELAARAQPTLFGAAYNAGRLAAGFGQAQRARRHFERAQRLRPQDSSSLQLELPIDAIPESTEEIARIREHFERGLDRLIADPPRIEDPLSKVDLTTFYLAYHGPCNRSLHMKRAQALIAAVPGLQWRAPHCDSPHRRDGRIRVGFLSRFLRTHSIGKVARGLMSELSRESFEVFALNIPPVAMDDTARLIQARADHWLVLAGDMAAAREQIAALELDILFYQDIGMEPASYLLSFARLARVQCVSYGHPDTTGVPNMDYYISSDLYEPPGAAAHYSERLFELQGLPTLAYYFQPALPAALPSRADLGLPADAHLYVCGQTLFKLHPDLDGIFRRILERDGSGQILLFTGECSEWSVRLMKRFRRTLAGVAERVRFLPHQTYDRFLHILRAADVVLDTLHFNGMNTSIDAFSVGTPVVTLPTGLQRGRFTQAMYRAMEIDWGVARDAEDYAALAVAAATDPERQQALRRLILERNHLLFEDRRAVAEFERFFLAAHQEAVG
jgi:predicted O-linked N-acetylglucosamine transferase (SPINDLY family)